MLFRKMLRDIRSNYGAYLACISVLVIGLMLYVSLSIILESLTASRDNYYSSYNFADGFASIANSPKNIVEDIENIPGVYKAIGRIVQDVVLSTENKNENTVLRIVSFDSQYQKVNSIRLEEGKIPSGDKKEILVSPAFLKANKYKIGDRIALIINGQKFLFTISGSANSPEYVYEIPNGQTLTPDPTAFGVAYVPYKVISPLMGMSGEVNDLVFKLDNGISFEKVKLSLTRYLEGYGLTKLYPRKDQLSASMLNQELVQLKGSVLTTPILFLLVAAAILFVMIKRMIDQQRGQIGTLKAFGFSEKEIILHYLSYPLLTGGLGGFIGGITGSWLSFYFARIYQQYYNVPNISGRISPGYILMGTLLSILFSVAAGYLGCKQMLRLSPAEAMRPDAPKFNRKTPVERITLLWKHMGSQTKMSVRNIFRSKQRSILVVIGIASSFAMMVASGALFDATYYLISYQYDKVEKYDLKVSLRNYSDTSSLISAVNTISGIERAEPILEIPATINNKWLEKDVLITGLTDNSFLFSLLSKNDKKVDLPKNGMVVSSQLAKTLSVKPGDYITVKPYSGERKEKKVLVRQVVPQYVGMGAYMNIEALSGLLNSKPVASSVLIKAHPDSSLKIKKKIQEGTNVLTVQDKTKMRSQFEQLLDSSKASQYILLFFAFVMGFAIVYNVNIISLSERERELATLAVVGMTDAEISKIVRYEQIFLGAVGIIFGIPFSYALLYGIVNSSSSEIYNMPLIIAPTSFVMGMAGTIMFLIAALWKTTGKISRLSMLDVLKQQE